MGLTLAGAELAGTVTESCLYGIFIMLFIGTLHVLVFRAPERQTSSGHFAPMPRMATKNRFLLSVSIALFVLATAHWIIQISRLFDAFIRSEDANAYYADQGTMKNVAKTALYVAATFVGDITIIYRLYIVWGKNKYVAIVPLVSSFTLLGSGITVCWSFSQFTPGEDFFTSPSGKYILIVFATSLFTNISATVLLTYRIWSVQRMFLKGTKGRAVRLLNIILESAALYTACLLVTHITYLTKDTFQFIPLDMTTPIIGISFSLIIVRVGLGLATEAQNPQISGSGPHRLHIQTKRLSSLPSSYGRDDTRSQTNSHIRMKPLAVNVSTHVTTEVDGVDPPYNSGTMEDDDSFLKMSDGPHAKIDGSDWA